MTILPDGRMVPHVGAWGKAVWPKDLDADSILLVSKTPSGGFSGEETPLDAIPPGDVRWRRWFFAGDCRLFHSRR